jgi:hypothetical protein
MVRTAPSITRTQTIKKLEKVLYQVENRGDLRTGKRIMAILAVLDGVTYTQIASILKICEESIRLWVNAFLLRGVEGLKSRKPPGKPSKLTKTQRKEFEPHPWPKGNKSPLETPVSGGFAPPKNPA